MPLKSTHKADTNLANPGTSNQTGNNAPRYRWEHATRILIAIIAYQLGATDDEMAKKHGKGGLPKARELHRIFCLILPWFPDHYNETLRAKAEARGYEEPLEPFNEGDTHGRLRYMFATPGSKRHSRGRKYGYSVEHHLATEQQNKRRITWNRWSETIERRVVERLPISQEEIRLWSKLK